MIALQIFFNSKDKTSSQNLFTKFDMIKLTVPFLDCNIVWPAIIVVIRFY